jgi:hypothetical protein
MSIKSFPDDAEIECLVEALAVDASKIKRVLAYRNTGRWCYIALRDGSTFEGFPVDNWQQRIEGDGGLPRSVPVLPIDPDNLRVGPV